MRTKKPQGYWKDFQNVKRELNQIIQEYGYFPSSEELKRDGHTSLVSSIHLYYGGFRNVQEKLGHVAKKRPKPSNYWKDWTRVEKELKKAIRKNNGEFPSHSRLVEMGLSGFSTSINKYHGGLNNIRKKTGLNTTRKPDGYWKKWENVKKELELAIVQNDNEFPSNNDLKRLGLESLASAIPKLHLGYRAVRKRMGYEHNRKPRGYWKDWNNVEIEMRQLTKDLKHFPTPTELQEANHGMYGALRYYGGFPAVREKIGYNAQMRDKLAKQLETIVQDLR